MVQNQNFPRLYQIEQNVLDNINMYLPHLEITIHDLRNPSPEVVSKFYSAFLEELGTNTSNLQQIQMNQMTLISHVDMYSVSVPMLNQYQCINFFLKNIGVFDFSVTDLVSPSSKKTLHFFDALLKFLSYCDDRISHVTPELDRIGQLGNIRNELLSKIEVVRNEINQRATERGRRREKIRDLETLVQKDKGKLDEMISEKEVQVSAMNSIKKLIEEDAEKEAQLIRTIKRIEEDVINLKEMIVKSPEKLKLNVAELNQKKEECLENVENLKIQIEEKKRLTYNLDKQQELQEERLSKLKELLEMKLNINNKEQERVTLLNECNKLQEQHEEHKLQTSSIEARREMILQNIEDQKNRKEKEEAQAREVLELTEKKFIALVTERKERKHRLDQILAEINQLHEDIRSMEGKHLAYKETYHMKNLRLQSMEEQLTTEYGNIILKLRSINEDLK